TFDLVAKYMLSVVQSTAFLEQLAQIAQTNERVHMIRAQNALTDGKTFASERLCLVKFSQASQGRRIGVHRIQCVRVFRAERLPPGPPRLTAQSLAFAEIPQSADQQPSQSLLRG